MDTIITDRDYENILRSQRMAEMIKFCININPKIIDYNTKYLCDNNKNIPKEVKELFKEIWK